MNKKFLSFSLGLVTLSIPNVVAKTKPNLLIFFTDEHNFRTLGCYRNTMPKDIAEPWGDGVVVETPNLDYLASKGAVFTRFYASDPVSSPSRSSFVTGMYPEKTHVVHNNLHMNDNLTTFGKSFEDNGYKTGYIGKWHLDGPEKPEFAPKANFGFEDNKYMFNRGHYKVMEEDKTGPHMSKSPNGKYKFAGDATAESFTTDFLGNRAVEYINRHKKEPFCLMVSIPDPHGPNTVREPYASMFQKLNFTNLFLYNCLILKNF